MNEPLTPKQVLENIIDYKLVGNEFTTQNVFRIQMAFKELEASIRKETIDKIINCGVSSDCIYYDEIEEYALSKGITLN